MAKAKGTTLIGAVKYLRSRRDEARGILATALHHYLDEKISISAWYPEEDLLALIRALLELVPGERQRALEEMGIATARAHGEGVYSHLLEGPGSSTKSFALWSSMHDTGELRMTDEGPNRALFELKGYASSSPEMCVIVSAYIRETLRSSGRIATVEKLRCVDAGDASCCWRCHWQDDAH